MEGIKGGLCKKSMGAYKERGEMEDCDFRYQGETEEWEVAIKVSYIEMSS